MRRPRIPIRVKILVALLFIVTTVVSLITFTMANMFHDDKRAYISEIVSVASASTAEECGALIQGYMERLQAFTRIMNAPDLEPERKQALLQGLFEDFPELVGIRLEDSQGEELTSVYETGKLEQAGLRREDYAALHVQSTDAHLNLKYGEVYVENSTLSRNLPTVTLTLLTPARDQAGTTNTLTAVVRMDRLLSLVIRARRFQVYLTDSAGRILASRNLQEVVDRNPAPLPPQLKNQGLMGAGMVVEFEENGETMLGGFHRVDLGGMLAVARIQKSAAFLASRDLLKSLILLALVLLALAALAGMLWAHRLTRPVENLSTATREIGRGKFDIRVKVQSNDEIGALASSFNEMASELRGREETLREINVQLVQSEKMAAFGQLGAGIAHEVKNPLAGILGCAQLAQRKADPSSMVFKNLQLIEKETKRCKTIIESLLKFARQEKTILQPTQVNSVVEDAVAIVNHQLELNKVKILVELDSDLPLIEGNANQLQQVFMNFLINAMQAMEGKPGLVRISTRRVGGSHIEASFADDGPGIPPDVRAKVFEPFFTTKPGGKGTGLGLSVSFGIIRDHKGVIGVDCPESGGTVFQVTLPCLQAGLGVMPRITDSSAAEPAPPQAPAPV